MATLNQLPDTLEVWRIGDQSYLVSFVPDTNPPIPLAWTIDDAGLSAAFGPGKAVKYDYENDDPSKINSLGVLIRGTHEEIPDTGEDPYLAWENAVTAQAAVRPYLADPGVLALIAEGLVENREIALAEFEQTTWWQEHNEAERAWLVLNLADPETASQRITSNQIAIEQQLRAAGVHNPPQELVDFMSQQFTHGAWTESMLANQVQAVSDPLSGAEFNTEMTAFLDGFDKAIDTSAAGEQEVRDMAQRWLGPIFGNLTDAQVAQWAGRIRNDPDGSQVLEEHLRSQRLAMFPTYEDQTLSYDDIAQPWRNFVTQEWGQVADETDHMFVNLVNLNDVVEGGKLLRKEGLQRDISKVKQDVEAGFLDTFGQIRRPI